MIDYGTDSLYEQIANNYVIQPTVIVKLDRVFLLFVTAHLSPPRHSCPKNTVPDVGYIKLG